MPTPLTAPTPTPSASTNAAAAPPLALAAIGQVALTVRSLPRAVAFYQDVLGMRLLFQAPPGLAFFDCAGIRLMLARPERPDEPATNSMLYYRVDDIGQAHAALSARGAHFESEPHRVARLADREVWMAFLRDSEGNLLGLMSEPPLPPENQ
jgi:methylmalonyl-CoA/ethylmalonyl-CoA epimerase